MSSPLSWDAFCTQLRPTFIPPFGCPESLAFALPTLEHLHWLDRQAIKLAARLDRPTRLVLDDDPPAHLRARLEAQCLTHADAAPTWGRLFPTRPASSCTGSGAPCPRPGSWRCGGITRQASTGPTGFPPAAAMPSVFPTCGWD
ncbi:hypothetical protein [Chloracidobacterium aggregatum]|uniref:hypothetical protein n=1 Tax=Chloracidobacterium aggregatum TaxID=2851959 RepID=UPI001B8D112B|nr:hypothetical protein [Chloracidobacterium aggregatum]QUV87104.1 hypothetical protein J8C07_07845 [Chloracidobacterium sp. S]QUV90006.1 hypothetical protein J8C04_06865 [Chloracidobacterium sp. A]